MKGYTNDGYPVVVPVDSMVDLAFVPIAIEWTGRKFSFVVALEFNKTPAGKKRPYLSVSLFGLHIQTGWLF